MLYATDAQMIVIASDRQDLRSIGFAGNRRFSFRSANMQTVLSLALAYVV